MYLYVMVWSFSYEAISRALRLEANRLSPKFENMPQPAAGGSHQEVVTTCKNAFSKMSNCTLSLLPPSFLYIMAGFLAFTGNFRIPCNQVAMNVHLGSTKLYLKKKVLIKKKILIAVTVYTLTSSPRGNLNDWR